MDQEDSVQTGTPKERTGVSEKEVASPAVGGEPAFDVARSDGGSRAEGTEGKTEAERSEETVQTTLGGFEKEQAGDENNEPHGQTEPEPRKPEQVESHPSVVQARAYGHTYTKKNGELGSNLIFRLPWRKLRSPEGTRLEAEKLYWVSGKVDGDFGFESYVYTTGFRSLIVYVPVKYADKVRPSEVHKLSILGVDQVETKKPVGELVDGIHITSWRRFAKSKLVDEANGEELLDGPPRQLSAVEGQWLAGVIDGEGSIFITKLNRGSAAKGRRGFAYVPAINLSNSNEEFARKVREVIGRGSVNFQKETRLDWKDRWCYRGAGMVLRGLLPQLVPHLLIKKEAAERMLEYLAYVDANPIIGVMEVPAGYYEKADSLYMALKRTNEKGRDPSPETMAAMLALPKSLKNRGRGGRATDTRTLTKEESSWLAGVIDGEGSIFLSKVIHAAYSRGYFYRPQLNVTNSNRDFCVKVMEIIGEGTVNLARRGDAVTKTRWEYNANSGVLRTILPQVMPYLIVKREVAGYVLEYLRFVRREIRPKQKWTAGLVLREAGYALWSNKEAEREGKEAHPFGRWC